MNPLVTALAALVEIPILISRMLAEVQHNGFSDLTIEEMLHQEMEDELLHAAH